MPQKQLPTLTLIQSGLGSAVADGMRRMYLPCPFFRLLHLQMTIASWHVGLHQDQFKGLHGSESHYDRLRPILLPY